MDKTASSIEPNQWAARSEGWTQPLLELRAASDPFDIAGSLQEVARGWLGHPRELSQTFSALAVDWYRLQLHAWQLAAGFDDPSPAVPARNDERFADVDWTRIPAFSIMKQHYLLFTRWLEDALYDTPGVAAKERRRTAFWVRQWLDAVAPSNCLFTNPVALRKCWQTGGESLLRGFKIWLDDVRVGDIQMVDRSAFRVGGNLAATPGAVVYRNQLMELIHYAPATRQVRAVPILFIPPWINKYYILDLTEKKSVVNYLVQQGFDVYMVSWKNPTPDMADIAFDDYLVEGIGRAVEVARAVSARPRVHAVGYCIGGTALAAMMAWYNSEFDNPEDVPVAHWTLLTTLLDFSRPGAIEVFIDDSTIGVLEEIMARQGFLDGREMARSFRMLRPNALVWHYVVHGYLYGETPPAFDVLYWNTDTTRMPRGMHSFYLREFYLNNRLVRKNGVTLAGHPIDLARIRQPLYAVGCEEDHIAPWKATFKNTSMIRAPARYTLTRSGHILGIVNPPVNPPKRSYWTGAATAAAPEAWLKEQREVAGSWWEDWVKWLAPRCGKLVKPPRTVTRRYSRLADAPGKYVHEI